MTFNNKHAGKTAGGGTAVSEYWSVEPARPQGEWRRTANSRDVRQRSFIKFETGHIPAGYYGPGVVVWLLGVSVPQHTKLHSIIR